MTRNARTVATIRGIEIRIHLSWIVIALLVGWSLTIRFTDLYGHSLLSGVLMAVAGGALFFASVLAHELAHALEARRRGLHVEGITLFLFGGVTEARMEAHRPVDELALTAIGPGTSLGLAAVFGALSRGADAIGWGQGGQVLGYLGWVNLALGAFNLLPGAPLDGGRILRSIVWWRTGDRALSSQVAARSGQVVGLLLAGVGVIELLLAPDAALGGMWLALIGWFLFQGARSEYEQAAQDLALSRLEVADLVDETTPPVEPLSPVRRAVDALARSGSEAVPVVSGGRLVGVVTLDRLRALSPFELTHGRVVQVMTPLEVLEHVDARSPADAVARLRNGQVVVAVEAGRPVGIVTARQLTGRLATGRRPPAGARP